MNVQNSDAYCFHDSLLRMSWHLFNDLKIVEIRFSSSGDLSLSTTGSCVGLVVAFLYEYLFLTKINLMRK